MELSLFLYLLVGHWSTKECSVFYDVNWKFGYDVLLLCQNVSCFNAMNSVVDQMSG